MFTKKERKIKMKSKANIRIQTTIKMNVVLVLLAVLLQGCNKTGSSSDNGSGGSNTALGGQALAAVQSPNFRLNLTDAPNGAFKSIKVNIESIEVVLTDGKKTAVVPLTKGAGVVDLLGLQNGVSMTMGDIQIPKGVKITELRLRLGKEGHEGLRANGKKCNLPVSCVKEGRVYNIKLDQEMEFDDESHSSLMVDFDAHESIKDDDAESESCGFNPAIMIKSAGSWKAEHKDDDDFESKGHELNNVAVVKDQKKKFEKHLEDKENEDLVSAANQCTNIPAPAPVVVTPPTVVPPVSVPGFFGAM